MLTDLRDFYPVSQDLFNAISEQCILKEFAKGEVLVTAGCECSYLYLILQGFTLCYFNKDGKECIVRFFKEGEFSTPVHCFRGGKKSFFEVKAHEDLVVLCFSRKTFSYFWQTSDEFKHLMTTVLEKTAAEYEDLYYWIHSKSALERVNHCLSKCEFQSLIKRVPQYRIASYLQMTPEYYAKMQRSLKKKM